MVDRFMMVSLLQSMPCMFTSHVLVGRVDLFQENQKTYNYHKPHLWING